MCISIYDAKKFRLKTVFFKIYFGSILWTIAKKHIIKETSSRLPPGYSNRNRTPLGYLTWNFFLPIILIIPYNFDFLNFFFTWLLVPPASIGQNVQYIKNLQFWIKWLEFKILHIILIIPYNFDFLNFFAPSLWLVLRLSAWARTLWVGE